MSDDPQTWHYGLVARWWAEFNQANPDELAFYRAFVERDGLPALDLACGTGRLLLPLLRAGFDVEGCDVSPDMLALCRQHAARDGLTPRLYEQAMHALELPRAYRTIFICDSFGIGGDRRHDAEALRRCYRHLAPGGTLVFSHDLPYDERRGLVRLASRGAAAVAAGVAGDRDAAAGGGRGRTGAAHPHGGLGPVGTAAHAPDPRGAVAGGAARGGGGAHPADGPVLPQRATAAPGPDGVRGGHGARRVHGRGGDRGGHDAGVRCPEGRVTRRGASRRASIGIVIPSGTDEEPDPAVGRETYRERTVVEPPINRLAPRSQERSATCRFAATVAAILFWL